MTRLQVRTRSATPTTAAGSVPANVATLCASGDSSSKKTLYLIDDSQASMWLNSFLSVLVNPKWRVVETAQTGCPRGPISPR